MTANLCPNPAAKNDLTGYTGTSGQTRVTGLTGFPRTTGLHFSGNGYVQTPAGVRAAGDTTHVSFYIANNTGFVQNNKTVYISYHTSGGDQFPETFQYSLAIGEKKRVTATSTVPAPTGTTGVYLVIDSLNGALGSGFDISCVMFDPDGINTYNDGDSSGWVWDGADGNSSSQPSSGPSVFVWNGSTEVPGALTVWNGSSEVSGTIEIAP